VNFSSSKQHRIAQNLVCLLLISIIFIQLFKVSKKTLSSESQLMGSQWEGFILLCMGQSSPLFHNPLFPQYGQSLQGSSSLILSRHKPQHYIPIQANTSDSSHKQAGIECSSPWLTHEPPLRGMLPIRKHALGSIRSIKDLAKMLVVHRYASYIHQIY